MSACAYFDSSDNSLNFVENTGGWTNGQVVGTKTYYTGFETDEYINEQDVPWTDYCADIDIVSFNIMVQPISTAYWFYYCKNLTQIQNLNLLDTSNVTDMSYMFRSCNSLTSLDLSNFNTSKVTHMHSMFSGCNSLTSLDLSSFDTSEVTDMGYMFYYCNSLTSLDLSSFDTSEVTDMGYMFYYCNSLTSLDLSTFDTGNVTGMNYMFRSCNLLKYIRVSNLWSTAAVTSSSSMFRGCTVLSNFDSTKTDKEMAYAGYPGYLVDSACAYYDSSDNSLNFVGDDNNYADGTVVGTKTYYKNIETTQYSTSSVPQWNTVGTLVEEVKVLISIKPISTAFWFSNCTNLSHIDLSLLDTSQVTDMRNMFDRCSSLTSLDLSSFDTGNVTDMRSMFNYCLSLTSLDLSFFDTGKVNDMSYMFRICSSLTSLDLSSFNTSLVGNMYCMFYNCSSLTSLNLSSFNTSNVTDMGSMFNGCSSLKLLDLSNFNTKSDIEIKDMFKLVKNLIVIIWDPNIITYYNYYLMFSEVTNLYIIRPANQRTNAVLATKWRNIIRDNPEIHFEYDDTLKPTITYTIERGKKVDNQWTPDDTVGTVIKLTYTPTVYQNDLSPLLETNVLDDTARVIYSDDIDISNLVTYTTEGTTIIAEFDIGDAEQHDIALQLQDKHDSPTLIGITLPGIFAMVEFRAGGKGMSIGKVATRDGLEIAIPTTIGDNLLYPTIIENGTDTGEIDLDNFQFTIGQYNNKDDSKAFIIGNGEYDTSTAQVNRSNAFTVDWSGRIDAGDYSGNFNSIFNIFYPVGSYYETSLPYTVNGHSYTDDNLTDADIALCGLTWFDPRVAWGGTWYLEIDGQVHVSGTINEADYIPIVGIDNGDLVNSTNTDTVNADGTVGQQQGGSKDAIVPSHTHTLTAGTPVGVTVSAHGITVTQPTINLKVASPNNTGSLSTSQVQYGRPTGTNYTNDNAVSKTNVGVSLTNNHSVSVTQPTFTVNSPTNGVAVTDKNMQPYIVVHRWHRVA